MENNIDNFDWELFQSILLGVTILVMLVLFKRDPKDSLRALLVGIGLVIIGILLNIINLIIISDGFTVFGFVIMTFSLFRLFWSETSKLK